MSILSLGQAVRNALEAERAAESFYRLLAQSTSDADARKFLLKMANLEKAHAATIEQMGIELRAGKLPAKADDNVELIETAPDWAYRDDMELNEAMELALENERHAALYYEAFADVTHDAVQAFFVEIVKDENRHVTAVEQALGDRVR